MSCRRLYSGAVIGRNERRENEIGIWWVREVFNFQRICVFNIGKDWYGDVVGKIGIIYNFYTLQAIFLLQKIGRTYNIIQKRL